MKVWRSRMIRLTGSAIAMSSRPAASTAFKETRVTQPDWASRSTRPLAADQAFGATVAPQEAVGDAVAVGPRVADGEECVVRRDGTGHVRRSSRAVFRAPAPGAVTHRHAVDGDRLAVQPELPGHATELVEVARFAERRSARGQRPRRHHAVEAERRAQAIAILVADGV